MNKWVLLIVVILGYAIIWYMTGFMLEGKKGEDNDGLVTKQVVVVDKVIKDVDVIIYEVGINYSSAVYELTLTDGTRCVGQYKGGIVCQWK